MSLLNSLFRREVPHYSRSGLYWQAGFVFACLGVLHFWQWPTVAIGLLAVGALIVAIRVEDKPNFTKREQLVWIALGCLLFAAEMKSIIQDRNQHDVELLDAHEESVLRIKEENDRFAEIAKSIERSIELGQAQFEATTAKSNQLNYVFTHPPKGSAPAESAEILRDLRHVAELRRNTLLLAQQLRKLADAYPSVNRSFVSTFIRGLSPAQRSTSDAAQVGFKFQEQYAANVNKEYVPKAERYRDEILNLKNLPPSTSPLSISGDYQASISDQLRKRADLLESLADGMTYP